MDIEFRGQTSSADLYDSASYEADVSLWNSIYHPLLGYPEIASAVVPFVQHLKDDGIVEYEFKENNISYLTVDDDVYYVSSTNGEVVVGGDGNDDLVGAEGVDYLLGGNGNDTFFGGMGDDFIDGGDGTDAFSSSDGGGVIRISADKRVAVPEIFRGVEEAPLILSFAIGSEVESDHLWNVEKISLGSSDQIIKLDGDINQTIRSLIIDGGDGDDTIDFFRFLEGDRWRVAKNREC